MKKTIIVLFTLIFLSVNNVVYSDDTTKDDTTKNDISNPEITYTLSLADAIEMAITDNPQLVANTHRQNANYINIKSAQITKNSLKGLPLNISSGFETFCMKEGYYVEAAKTTYELSIKEAEKIKANISYNVTEAYYNVLLLQKLVYAAQNSYNLTVENINTVEAQYKLGLVSKLDYENAKISVTIANNTLSSYILNKDIAIDNLKILLNKYDEKCTIVLTDEIECEEYTSDVETDIVNALNTRYDITALKKQKNLAEQYFELSKPLTEETAIYNNAYASYIEAENNFENTKKLISLSIKSTYNNILTANANMNIAKEQYETEAKKLEAAKLKYELGMITNSELTQTINTLYEVQTNYANAKLTYRMAVEKYKYEISIGL